MDRGDAQVHDAGHVGGKGLVQPAARSHDIGRHHAEVIRRSRKEACDARAHTLRCHTGNRPGKKGNRVIAGVGAVLELHRRGPIVGIDGAIQGRTGRADSVSRAGDCGRGRNGVDCGRVIGSVVGQVCVAAAGDAGGVGDVGRGVGIHVHSNGNGRIGCAGGEGL